MATRSVRDSLKPTQTNASKALNDLASLSATAALKNKPKVKVGAPVKVENGTWSVKVPNPPKKIEFALNLTPSMKINSAIKSRTINEIDFDKVKDVLPNTLGELLGVALKDLVVAENSGLKIYMDNWVDNVGTDTCSVCLAGSVINGTLGIPVKEKMIDTYNDTIEDISPEAFSSDIQEKLESINSLREGDLQDAIELLYPINILNDEGAVFQKWFKAARKHLKLKSNIYKELDDGESDVEAFLNAIDTYVRGTYNKVHEYSYSRSIFMAQMQRLQEILTDLKI